MAQNLFMQPSRDAASKDVPHVLLNLFFFHKSNLFLRKTKALLLLQIDDRYKAAIAAVQCVFLLYVYWCHQKIYRLVRIEIEELYLYGNFTNVFFCGRQLENALKCLVHVVCNIICL